MADITGLPDAVDLGNLDLATILEYAKLSQILKYRIVVTVAGGVLNARAIPTFAALETALAAAAAGLP